MSSSFILAASATLLGLLVTQQPVLVSPASTKAIVMTQNTQTVPFKLSATLLEVYEDRTEPPGSRMGANRPVGHAVLRLRIENLTQKNVKFKVIKIAIQDVNRNDNKQSLMSQDGKEVNLGGLQILEPGFHLTNRQGFLGTRNVKAVVNYQFNGKTYTVQSAPFVVKVNP